MKDLHIDMSALSAPEYRQCDPTSLIDAEKRSKFLEKVYNGSAPYLKSRDLELFRMQALKLCDAMDSVGLRNFGKLREKFTGIYEIRVNSKQWRDCVRIKEAMEQITM